MKKIAILLLLALCLMPAETFAHHAEWMQGKPFIQGLSMPVHGVDHMLVTFGVGLMAAEIGGMALWAIPAAFSLWLLLGGLLNVSGVSIPFAEQAIIATVALVAGAQAAGPRMRLPMLASVALVSLFAAMHGSVLIQRTHGNWSFHAFAGGCLLSAAALQLAGILTGFAIKRFARQQIFRYAGWGMLAMSAVICVFPAVNDAVIRLLE